MASTQLCMRKRKIIVDGTYCILNERYVAMTRAADKFDEMVELFKQKHYGGDANLHAAAAMSE